VLEELELSDFLQSLTLDGFKSPQDLLELNEEDAKACAEDAGMKRGHTVRFCRWIRENSSSAAPPPAVDPFALNNPSLPPAPAAAPSAAPPAASVDSFALNNPAGGVAARVQTTATPAIDPFDLNNPGGAAAAAAAAAPVIAAPPPAPTMAVAAPPQAVVDNNAVPVTAAATPLAPPSENTAVSHTALVASVVSYLRTIAYTGDCEVTAAQGIAAIVPGGGGEVVFYTADQEQAVWDAMTASPLFPVTHLPELADFARAVAGCLGRKFERQKDGALYLRKLLSIERNPEIDAVLSSGVAPSLFAMLDPPYDGTPELQVCGLSARGGCHVCVLFYFYFYFLKLEK
jgi:hypothetical protein